MEIMVFTITTWSTFLPAISPWSEFCPPPSGNSTVSSQITSHPDTCHHQWSNQDHSRNEDHHNGYDDDDDDGWKCGHHRWESSTSAWSLFGWYWWCIVSRKTGASKCIMWWQPVNRSLSNRKHLGCLDVLHLLLTSTHFEFPFSWFAGHHKALQLEQDVNAS